MDDLYTKDDKALELGNNIIVYDCLSGDFF